MTYDWAKPGVKVVCIDDSNSYRFPNFNYSCSPILVVKGMIYEIEYVNPHPDGSICIVLKEVPKREKRDWGYNVNRFRPLVTKPLPESLSCLLSNPKSVIVPDKFDYKKTWEPV
jgi:hypothetical protein